jgi:hypothetical protein
MRRPGNVVLKLARGKPESEGGGLAVALLLPETQYGAGKFPDPSADEKAFRGGSHARVSDRASMAAVLPGVLGFVWPTIIRSFPTG